MNAERNHLEEKLNMLEFCIDSIPDAVYWVALDGRFWNVNAAACEMLGYSREEILLLSVHDIDPDYSHESMQSDLELLKQAGTLSLRRSHTAKDGRIIPVEITTNYFIYSDVEYICCIVRDITECVKAEKEAAFLGTLIEYTRDPFYVVSHTRGSRLVYVNDAACVHWGRPREELLTMRIFDLDATLDKQDIDKIFEELKQEESLRFETIHQLASGNMVPVEVTANYLELDGEELAVGFFHDISRRKAMETELLQAQEELEKRVEERTAELARTTDALMASEHEKSLILNVSDALVLYYDTEMNILWANKAAGDSVNMPPVELQKRRCWEVWHQRHEPCIGCPVLRARDTEQPQEAETRSPDGRAWFIRGFPVKNETGRLIGMVEFCQDFTERKQMEESLRKAHGEMESKVRERTGQLTSLTAELSLAEERERRRIATELHDQVGQTLILSKIKLDSLSRSLPSESFGKQIGEISKYLDQSIQEIRSLTFQLSPPLLYEVG
ncbi:MAG TPA: PAS domain S-box protein, partial [Geobacteraceae bacterium]|nr:PAS domain S-box protein [Geobacteraceae bacterium]